MAYETLEIERRGGATTITLNRPDVLNAMNRTLTGELLEALREAEADDAVRAVCITGAGRAFSAGADLRDVGGLETTAEGHANLGDPMRERYSPLMTTIRAMPKPVVAAVNGGASGIGCSLALACDLVVAASSSYFLLAFVGIGLTPDGGAMAFINQRAGATRAMEMALLGRQVPALTAEQWGLVNTVVDDADLLGHAAALIDRLAAGPTRSYAASKRQLNHWIYDGRLEDQLELEAVLQQQMAGTRDFAEGVGAFLGKREPAFEGA